MNDTGYLLGLDIGSSSIKASLLDIENQKVVASATSPESEMEIISPKPGWAEQHPETWWSHVRLAIAALRRNPQIDMKAVRAIGIAYQMHGLVMVDKNEKPLANAIIWCDSRAVETGERACAAIGGAQCLSRLLNPPGNFTASKLAWVKEHLPDVYKKIHKIMLPGDYIAMKLTGDIFTTPGGLSEGIMWDFTYHRLADFLFDHFDFSYDLVPKIVPCFSAQGGVTAMVAQELGIEPGVPVSYRAGDQPNNALSLAVLEPGEIAATAGTSGVVYGVSDAPVVDPASRLNTFAHVNYTPGSPRYGVLLCVNGTGVLNRWLRRNLCTVGGESLTYEQMNAEAWKAPPACEGLMVFPYGNGAERTLGNRNVSASIHGLDFSVHARRHLLRASQEGVVFALKYGLDIMRKSGILVKTVRAGHANMFKSELFGQVFAAACNATVELYNTDGAQGSARGAGIGAGIFPSVKDAFKGLSVVRTIPPDKELVAVYAGWYRQWADRLDKIRPHSEKREAIKQVG